MNIKNIQPPECPEALTTEEILVIRAVRDLSPDQLARLIEMLEVAEVMLAKGDDDDVIAQHLLNTYGDV